MANRIANAYVQIIPTAEGITDSITQVIAPEADSAGTEAGELIGNNLVNVAKGIIAAAGLGLAVKNSIDAVGSLAEFGDTIDKQSQKIGISRKAYQEWDAVLQHSGTSVSSMQTALRTLSNAAVDGSDAFEKVGLSLDDVQSMSQEDLFSAVITQLQGMEAGTERTALAQDLLGRSAQEMAALLNTSAEDTQAMKDAVNELGGVMSDDAVAASAAYQDSLQDMQTAIDGAKRGIISEFLPSFTEVMNGITQIFGGDASSGVGMVASGIKNIGSTIAEALPDAINGARDIAKGVLAGLAELVPALAEQVPEFIQSGVETITGFIDGFLSGIPDMLTGVGEMMSGVIEYLMTTGLPSLVTSAGSLIGGLVQALWDNLPTILTAAGEMLGNIATTFVDNLPTLAQGLVTAFTGAGSQAMEAFKTIDWHAVGKTAINFIATAAQGAGNLISTALRTIGSLAMTAFRNINWASVGKAAISFIGTAARGALNLALSALKYVGNSAKEAFKNIDWAGVGKTIIGFIGSAIRGVKDKVVNALKNAGTSAKDAFKNIDWEAVGKKAISLIGSAIRNVKENVVNALKSAGNSAKDAFKNIDWKSVGSNVINGIKNGITSTAYKIRDAARSAASSALAKAKDFLGIHSPSTVFRDQVGKMIGLGWAEGIENTAGALSASAKTAASDAFKSAQDAFKPLNMDGQVNIGTNVQNADISRLASAKGQLATADERQDVGDALLNLLLMYLPQLASEKGIYLDTGKLVGELADPLDRELGYRASYSRG